MNEKAETPKVVEISNVDVADMLEFGSIVPVDELEPPKFWGRCWLSLIWAFAWSLKAAVLMLPAYLYCWAAVVNWELLKAEGVTVWQAGSGLVALYGLGLHWWRTSVQERQYKAEREQVRLLNRQFRWQQEKERQARQESEKERREP